VRGGLAGGGVYSICITGTASRVHMSTLYGVLHLVRAIGPHSMPGRRRVKMWGWTHVTCEERGGWQIENRKFKLVSSCHSYVKNRAYRSGNSCRACLFRPRRNTVLQHLRFCPSLFRFCYTTVLRLFFAPPLHLNPHCVAAYIKGSPKKATLELSL